MLCGKPVMIGGEEWNERYDYPCHRLCANSAKAQVDEQGFLRYEDLQHIIRIFRGVDEGTVNPANHNLQEYIAAIVRTAQKSQRRNGIYAAKTLWIIDNHAWDVKLSERTGQAARRPVEHHRRRSGYRP